LETKIKDDFNTFKKSGLSSKDFDRLKLLGENHELNTS
jgi:hypothetical protein